MFKNPKDIIDNEYITGMIDCEQSFERLSYLE